MSDAAIIAVLCIGLFAGMGISLRSCAPQMKRRDHRYKYDETGEAKMTLLRRVPLLKRNNQSLGKSR
ncbi:MAG TPA: hypothetical protein VL492_05895, partial [Methylovirgula sp.]|nr:hypothetical protein [Methylovirgula sp.]